MGGTSTRRAAPARSASGSARPRPRPLMYTVPNLKTPSRKGEAALFGGPDSHRCGTPSSWERDAREPVRSTRGALTSSLDDQLGTTAGSLRQLSVQDPVPQAPPPIPPPRNVSTLGKATSAWQASLADTDALLVRLRAEVAKRGGIGITGISRSFRVSDGSGDRKLDRAEFGELCRRCKLSALDDVALDALFRRFDKNGNGSMDFEEFLHGVRGGKLSGLRRREVLKVFDFLDQRPGAHHDGQLTADDLHPFFTAWRHPDVVNGSKQESEILSDFLGLFESRGKRDGVVTREEWLQYYEGVSAGIDSDEYFAEMLGSVWSRREGDQVSAALIGPWATILMN